MEKCSFTLIIPSLDPDEKLTATVRDAIANGIDDILLVDDGSKTETRHFFDELETFPEVVVLRHEVNRGKGAALKTAMSYFRDNRPDRVGVVTADGDGQHATKDIIACADAMRDSISAGAPAVILGCRDFTLADVPPRSRFGNRCTSLSFRLFCGMKLSDTQTGLRAIPRDHVDLMLTVNGSRYEYETNMLLMMGQRKIPYREVTIATIYLDNNSASHFRPVRDSLRVYSLLLKYAASSLSSSLIDLLCFYLFGLLIFTGGDRLDVLLCTLLARVISSVANFALNKRVVFEDRGGVMKTFFRYVCLAVPVMLASWLTVYALSTFAGEGLGQAGRTLIKIPVDAALFLISFRVQRSWVFGSDSKVKTAKKH